MPGDVALFMRLPGLGAKTAARIWHELGVTTLDELRAAAEQQRLRELGGLGAKTEERILKALSDTGEAEPFRPLLGDALPALLAVVGVLRDHPASDQVSDAGSAGTGALHETEPVSTFSSSHACLKPPHLQVQTSASLPSVESVTWRRNPSIRR